MLKEPGYNTANRLRWFGHICRRDSWINKCTQHEVAGKQECSLSLKILT